MYPFEDGYFDKSKSTLLHVVDGTFRSINIHVHNHLVQKCWEQIGQGEAGSIEEKANGKKRYQLLPRNNIWKDESRFFLVCLRIRFESHNCRVKLAKVHFSYSIRTLRKVENKQIIDNEYYCMMFDEK